MLERYRTSPSGRRVEREWWIATKYGIWIFSAMVAAYVVHITLLAG